MFSEILMKNLRKLDWAIWSLESSIRVNHSSAYRQRGRQSHFPVPVLGAAYAVPFQAGKTVPGIVRISVYHTIVSTCRSLYRLQRGKRENRDYAHVQSFIFFENFTLR